MDASPHIPPGMLTELLQTVPSTAARVKVEMVLRIWSPGLKDGEPAQNDQGIASHPGLAAMLEDFAASKSGSFSSARNQLCVYGLQHPNDALVIARRIQLGVQGYRSNAGNKPVAVSIAIDSSSQSAGAAQEAAPPAAGDQTSAVSASEAQTPEPSHDLLTLLKLCKPAQILLTHDLCQLSPAIRGLPLKSFPGRFGVYEYLWTAPEKLETLQSEPQLTLAAVAVEVAVPVKETPAAAIPVGPPASAAPAESLALQPIVHDWRAALRSPRTAVFAGLALAVVAIGAFVGIRLSHDSSPSSSSSSSATNTAATQPAGAPGSGNQTARPAVSSPPTSTTPAATGSQTASASGKSSGPSLRKQMPEKHPTTSPAPASSCDVTGDLSSYLRLAQQARGRGDYTKAIRLFRDVLNCDPNNAAARDGLNRALQGQEQARH